MPAGTGEHRQLQLFTIFYIKKQSVHYRILRSYKDTLHVMLYHCRFLNPRLKNAICKSEFSVLFQLFSNFFDGCFQELLIGRVKNRYAKTLFFLWHLAHIRSRPFQKVSHDLIELRGVLGGDDGNACAFLDCLPCDSGGFTALAGNHYVL